MANTTYLDLTNKLLNRFNEVNLTSATFGNARSVHALAKDAILYAINQINQQNWKWPFNYVDEDTTNDVLLVIGTQIYDYPTGAEDIDFDNIYLKPDSTLSIAATRLQKIGHDQYKRYLKDRDKNATTASQYGAPQYTFRTPGLQIGISPKPRYAYTITAPYWLQPTAPSGYNDATTIPTRFDDVIVDGAEVYMQKMRKNEGAMTTAQKTFDDQVKRMRKLLINESSDMESTMLTPPSGRSLLYLNSL